jgi:drug/metabolite transporter (DMT)-like permease
VNQLFDRVTTALIALCLLCAVLALILCPLAALITLADPDKTDLGRHLAAYLIVGLIMAILAELSWGDLRRRL